MAGIKKIYTSQNQYVEDLAMSSPYFDYDYYETAKEAGKGLEYTTLMANAKDNISSTFDVGVYDTLSGEDKFNYFATENFMDKSSQEYKDSQSYFSQKIKQIKNEQIYNSLSGFEKFLHTTGGVFANVGLQLVGIVENLIDAAPTVVGQIAGALGDEETFQATKEFVAKDTTGYSAAQEELNDYFNKYTFIDKHWFAKGVNDVLSGIARMTPLLVGNLIGGPAAWAGTAAYYSALYGSSAEELYKNNPNVNWLDSLIYTGGTVGIEAITEWASGKLFGTSWFDPVNPSKPLGSLTTFGKDLWHDVWTEGVEEAISEIFGGALYQHYVDPDKNVSLQDILYAAIIGGVTGGVLSGGRALFGTTRYANYEGKIVKTSELTKEQLKKATKLGFGKSYELNARLQQAQDVLYDTNNVTKLQAEHTDLSLDQIKTQYAEEYKKARATDIKNGKHKAEVVLGLAKFMSEIGEENFKKAVDTLDKYSAHTAQMVDNYLNQTDVYNKVASNVFKEMYPDKSFSAVAMPTKSEQLLAKTLREAYPDLKVVFGTFGSKDGLSVASINGTEGYLFVQSGLVDTKGFDAVLGESIRNELVKDVLTDLSAMSSEHVDALATLIKDKATKYSDLTEKEKLDLAKIICFDPVANKRLFRRDNKLHAKIFKSLTNNAEYVKRFGRQTKANKIKYHDLLEIRNMFFENIAQTISNSEDVQYVQNEYGLSDEEVKTKLTDKTVETILNRYVKVTQLNQSKDTILRKEAYNELWHARKSEIGDFDFTRLYDSEYYKTEFVASITQNTKDFKDAMDAHLQQNYQTDFSTRTEYIEMFKENISEKMTRDAANTLLTKEFLDSNPDYSTLQDIMAEQFWLLTNFGVIEPDLDSIVVKKDSVEGTGKLKPFINITLFSDKELKIPQLSSGILDAKNAMIAPDVYRKVKYTAARNTRGIIPVYHGTDAVFENFDARYIDMGGGRTYGPGFYFTDTPEQARRHTTKQFTEKYYLNIEHPANLSRITISQEDIDSFIEKYFKDDITDVQESIAKASNDNDVISTVINYAYRTGILTNDFLDDMVDTLGVDGTITPPLDNGAVNYIVYSNRNIVKTGMNIQLFAEKIETDFQNIKQTLNTNSPAEIATAITNIVANSPIAYSSTQGFDETDKEYTKVAQSMIDENFSLFRKINQENYQRIRDEIANKNQPYTDQALIIFDRALFTYAEDASRFDEATQEKIKNQARRTQTISAQWQGLQSRRLADKTSLTEIKNNFAEHGIDVSVSDDMVKQYVPEMANKKDFIKKIDENISKIEQQIENAPDYLDKAALNKQLRDETDKRIAIDKGTNEEILDWAITNEDIVLRAAKIQKSVFEQMVEKAELAKKTPGKKAIAILVDDKTGLPKPFPRTTQFIQNTVKGLKSFRMWAMLTSPVSWVRNWVGNAGMTVLDKATNIFEQWMTSRWSKFDIEKLESRQKELQKKKGLSPTEKAELAEINAQIARAYDFKFVESTASKELKRKIAEDYKDVFQQILNGDDVSKYEGSSERAGAIARAEREITRKSANANFISKVWSACQTMTDWGLNTGTFGDNSVVLNSLIKNFANMVESNKLYLIKSLTTEYGKDGSSMSDDRKALVEKALKSQESIDIINAMSKTDVELFMDSCKQRTFEQYFKNSNWLSKWASNLSQKHPILASITSLVLPFPKVAANVLTMAYKYSPLGFVSAIRQWSVVKQMDATGYKGYRDAFAKAKLIRTTSQATVGSIMCIAGLILAAIGAIDIEEDDYLGPVLHIGDLRISLSNLAPSMTTLSVGAGMMWAWKNDKSAALQALDVLYDNTLLGNIENIFRYGDSTKYIENLSINYVSQYVPAMLKLFAKFTTNQQMIDKSGGYFEKLGKTFVSGLPFAANLLPKKINPYTGEFLTNTGSENWFFNFIEAISPLDFETYNKTATQKEAERLGSASSGLNGKFKVNDKEYDVDKVLYGQYRATYIQNNFEKILSGKEKVTVENEDGKRITTTYDKLNDKQKKNVLERLYVEATNITKIKWWTDQGNKYVVTNDDLYKEYRRKFKNIIYKKTWTKSKFVES